MKTVAILTELLSGASEFRLGATELLLGVTELLSGATELLSGATELLSGATELLSGAAELLSWATGFRFPVVDPTVKMVQSPVFLSGWGVRLLGKCFVVVLEVGAWSWIWLAIAPRWNLMCFCVTKP
jgi:X-X-X-Leu-X-X-Gly heptad repeat protein